MPTTIAIAPGVKLLKNVMIPTRDGTQLAADLYMPDGPESTRGWDKFPAIMEYIPYRKDEVAPGSRHYFYMARHGYVAVRIDIRGSGGSEGANIDEYTLQEQLDGVDAIEWLAEQPWCDGHVNLIGISYGGFTSVQLASHAPPHLTSIIPIDFTDERYTDDCHYRGGLLRKYFDVGSYGTFMMAFNAMPAYPEWAGSEWARVWEEHLANNEPYQLNWLRHQTDDDYWLNGSVQTIADRIKCPAFMISGWKDGYINAPLRLYSLLNVPKKVLMGPWNHSSPDTGIPGPRIDYYKEVVRWLDYWCKGIDTGIMSEPPINVYMQRFQEPVVDRIESEGEWRAETDWPAPDLTDTAYYLNEGGALSSEAGASGAEEYDYHPAVGVTGGLFSAAFRFGLPGDQRPDEAYSLNFTSDPLDKEVSILGWAHAILHVASTASVMGFAATLTDVAPDGTTNMVSKGMLNGTRRKSLVDIEAMTPGEVYELDIQIDCTGWVFEKGHRIRLSLASADWPNVWPTPYLGRNTVYRGGDRPSRLVLPVVPEKPSAPPPQYDPSQQVVVSHTTATRPPTWEVIHDVLTGRRYVKIVDANEFRVNDTTVIRREYSNMNEVDPKDPAHATCRGRTICRIIRPNVLTESQADVFIQSTATHFHVIMDIAVRVNDAPHFTRRWVESIERQLL